MTAIDCEAPLPFDRLVDYTAGDLASDDEERIEAHYFGCSRCARRLALVEGLGAAVSELVRRGAARATVTRDVAERIAREGLALRRYVLAPGEAVPCTAAPGDDFVLVELLGRPGAGTGAASVEVETRVFPSGATTRHTLLASLDPESRSILMLFPADAVRSFPRSRWTMWVSVQGAASVHGAASVEGSVNVEGAPEPAPYVLDHTPWQELAGGEPPPG